MNFELLSGDTAIHNAISKCDADFGKCICDMFVTPKGSRHDELDRIAGSLLDTIADLKKQLQQEN